MNFKKIYESEESLLKIEFNKVCKPVIYYET